nr:hypothetical protein Hi04_10k_c4921_00016 [uncultured bacterium]
MGFFAELSSWLNGILANYISTNTTRVAQVLEPAIVTLGVLYVMCWGFLHLTGRIEQPLLEGLKRIAVVALILGMSLQLWLYNDVIVDTFFNAPSQLAAAIVGAYDSVTIIDAIIDAGDQTASLLLQKGGLFGGDITYYIAGFAVYALVYVTAIYTMFLLLLSRVALSILLALGPLFIALLFFESTKRFVEAWLAQLANYAFVAILAVLVAALMLTVLAVRRLISTRMAQRFRSRVTSISFFSRANGITGRESGSTSPGKSRSNTPCCCWQSSCGACRWSWGGVQRVVLLLLPSCDPVTVRNGGRGCVYTSPADSSQLFRTFAARRIAEPLVGVSRRSPEGSEGPDRARATTGWHPQARNPFSQIPYC